MLFLLEFSELCLYLLQSLIFFLSYTIIRIATGFLDLIRTLEGRPDRPKASPYIEISGIAELLLDPYLNISEKIKFSEDSWLISRYCATFKSYLESNALSVTSNHCVHEIMISNFIRMFIRIFSLALG